MWLFLTNTYSQDVLIDSTSFSIKHGPLTFYLDADTASFISVQKITYPDILRLTGVRSDKWHKEKPFGPYKKEYYLHTGYDLGHLTPSNITSYNDSLNYNSFSFFNQAPQLAGFNRGKWANLEGNIELLIIKKQENATIVTGVIYNNINKEYLDSSRVKIPVYYFKIVFFLESNEIHAWLGSNVNGLLLETTIANIIDIAKQNKNKVYIRIN